MTNLINDTKHSLITSFYQVLLVYRVKRLEQMLEAKNPKTGTLKWNITVQLKYIYIYIYILHRKLTADHFKRSCGKLHDLNIHMSQLLNI